MRRLFYVQLMYVCIKVERSSMYDRGRISPCTKTNSKFCTRSRLKNALYSEICGRQILNFFAKNS